MKNTKTKNNNNFFLISKQNKSDHKPIRYEGSGKQRQFQRDTTKRKNKTKKNLTQKFHC